MYMSMCLCDRLLSTSSYDVSDDADAGETCELDMRVMSLNSADPVVRIKLKDALFSQLTQLRTLLGDENFNQLLNTADTEIVQQLQSFIK